MIEETLNAAHLERRRAVQNEKGERRLQSGQQITNRYHCFLRWRQLSYNSIGEFCSLCQTVPNPFFIAHRSKILSKVLPSFRQESMSLWKIRVATGAVIFPLPLHLCYLSRFLNLPRHILEMYLLLEMIIEGEIELLEGTW